MSRIKTLRRYLEKCARNLHGKDIDQMLLDKYVVGGMQTRHAYDSALRKLFGPLGTKISDYLIKIGTK